MENIGNNERQQERDIPFNRFADHRRTTPATNPHLGYYDADGVPHDAPKSPSRSPSALDTNFDLGDLSGDENDEDSYF
jgi:hypothetical protein